MRVPDQRADQDRRGLPFQEPRSVVPFRPGSFDAVVSISTLDHFEDAADIEVSLAEIHRVLEPGGCLVITLDNPGNPVVGLRNSLPWTWLHAIGLVPY